MPRMIMDKVNRFYENFNPDTGAYFRSGVIEDMRETDKDPFMREFPNLIDIGIMGQCVCAEKCNVDCYQKAIDRRGNNMSLEDYASIIKQSEKLVFQVALGGAGDPDTHENFPEIMKLTREHGIVPNFTTSGITFTAKKAKVCQDYAGAVAVSEHNANYTRRAIDLLLSHGVKTNVHYVLSAESIDAAIERLRNNYYGNLNAVVFLLYKPIGLGKIEKVLKPGDPRLAEFFKVIEQHPFTHKIGFDSCSAPAVVNYTSSIDMNSMDFCEAGRFSMYIDADMNAMPCSFGNQNPKYFVSLRNHTISEAWHGEIFEAFRNSLRNSCPSCAKREMCAGGCPICREIVLCDRKEMELL